MIIGIDLLWVKHKVTGGMEAYARNLLDGFALYPEDDHKFILYLAKDNYESFSKYEGKDNFQQVICGVESMKVSKRIIWETLFLNGKCRKDKVDILFTPIYSKPLFNGKGMKYVTVIHDLQALHFPEYFSKVKYNWLKFSWKRCADSSDSLIAISNFVRQDIIERLNINGSKIKVIYNPIIKSEKTVSFEELEKKLDIEKENYLYTVSALLPHKNLKTLLYIMKEIKEQNIDLPQKLVITGVGGKSKGEIGRLIQELGIENNVLLTGFVSDEERDCLYKNAKVFLFASIFEGFGMPPIEAMSYGTPVVISDRTCLMEVTQGQATYVEDVYSVDEWLEKIKAAVKKPRVEKYFPEYRLDNVTAQYMDVFNSTYGM